MTDRELDILLNEKNIEYLKLLMQEVRTNGESDIVKKKIEYLKLLAQEKAKFEEQLVSDYCAFPLLDIEYSEEKMNYLKEWSCMRFYDIYYLDTYLGRYRRKKNLTELQKKYHYYLFINIELNRLASVKSKWKGCVPALPVEKSGRSMEYTKNEKVWKNLLDVLHPPYNYTEENYSILVNWEDTTEFDRIEYHVREIKPGRGSGYFPETDEGIAAFLRNGGDM
jgi:hypothetical protein